MIYQRDDDLKGLAIDAKFKKFSQIQSGKNMLFIGLGSLIT